MNVATFLFKTPFLSLLLLFGNLVLTCLSTALLRMGKIKCKEALRHSHFFFRPIFRPFFAHDEWDSLHIAIGLGKNIFQPLYSLIGFFYLATEYKYFQRAVSLADPRHDWPPLLLAAAILLLVLLALDFCARLATTLWCKPVLKFCAPFASIYLLIVFPIVGLLIQISRGVLRRTQAEEAAAESLPSRAQIKEWIRESEFQHHLDPTDQKLISSFIKFKERVAKEIMVPRVNLFSLAAETPISEAAQLFSHEGYSRIPIYRDTLDQIVGVVLYKDLLKVYAHPPQGEASLSEPIETIAKPVLYAPENKKISQLLQEFRSKQIHMAIIVDEYGGTEGIVTIEDILEELVGEIEDEYDIGEGRQFWALPTGGWIVDAKMSINDIEDQLGIRIPENPDYETVGGYVFHCAGTIPAKGWRLLHNEFDLEVLSSDERSIKKIKIIPHPSLSAEE